MTKSHQSTHFLLYWVISSCCLLIFFYWTWRMGGCRVWIQIKLISIKLRCKFSTVDREKSKGLSPYPYGNSRYLNLSWRLWQYWLFYSTSWRKRWSIRNWEPQSEKNGTTAAILHKDHYKKLYAEFLIQFSWLSASMRAALESNDLLTLVFESVCIGKLLSRPAYMHL
jgi:hypothetical protein